MESRGTNREVMANKSNIIIKNKTYKICSLIDVAIPSDRNVIRKEAGKELKYNGLRTEIQGMWNMECFVTTVIIGANEIVTECLKLVYGNNSRKAFSRFYTNSYTRDIAHK
jgi:hypothetical protein